MYNSFFKRLLDFTIAFCGLIILSPIFMIITIGLFIVNQGNPFFFQLRPGKDERLFKIIKFKTMNDKKDNRGCLLPDANRLTSIGGFVRRTSLDEIPQLFNILNGDMSLIGPRPLLIEYLPLYSKQQARRHEVRPGISGWAQVNGRNAMFFSKRFEYDVWYVDHLTFLLDLKIILMTIKGVLKSEGVINGQDVHDVDDLNFNRKQ